MLPVVIHTLFLNKCIQLWLLCLSQQVHTYCKQSVYGNAC